MIGHISAVDGRRFTVDELDLGAVIARGVSGQKESDTLSVRLPCGQRGDDAVFDVREEVVEPKLVREVHRRGLGILHLHMGLNDRARDF